MTKIYYHSGLDIGGSERQVKVFAATDALVVSAGDVVLEGYRDDTPVAARYDVVYLLDNRGWYYRYSHLDRIHDAIRPGRVIDQGTEIGLLGKKGASGGWSHLHFEIKSRHHRANGARRRAMHFCGKRIAVQRLKQAFQLRHSLRERGIRERDIRESGTIHPN